MYNTHSVCVCVIGMDMVEWMDWTKRIDQGVGDRRLLAVNGGFARRTDGINVRYYDNDDRRGETLLFSPLHYMYEHKHNFLSFS